MTEKKRKKTGYLEGSLLVATPLLHGSYFEKAVIYICAHNETGAMGILVNHTIANLKCADLLRQVGVKSSTIKCDNLPVYFGGPIESAKGFILHTGDYRINGTQVIQSNISLTSTVDILQDIAAGKGPYKQIFALGYAGWEAGQVEKEFKESAWITIPASERIIFDADNTDKWSEAAASVGINFTNYSPVAGSA